MDPQLNADEKQFVNELLQWDRSGRKIHRLICQLCLLLGTTIFVVSSLLTLQNLDDKTILSIMLPGSITAIVLFLVYWAGEHRIKEYHLFSSVLKKLSIA